MAIVAMGELGAVPGVAADALVRAMMGADICVRTESLNRPDLRAPGTPSTKSDFEALKRCRPEAARAKSG